MTWLKRSSTYDHHLLGEITVFMEREGELVQEERWRWWVEKDGKTICISFPSSKDDAIESLRRYANGT